MSDALRLTEVEKEYGGLRPLRVRDLRVAAGSTVMLLGFDRPAAEVFVNLATGAALPNRGEVVSLGTRTHEIANSDDWLAFVERFGIVSDRIVLLEAMTVVQNLAISFDLNLDPVPAPILGRVAALSAEVGIEPQSLQTRVADASPLLRSQIHLARAIALDPSLILLEHPTAALSTDQGRRYAAIVKDVASRRRLTVIGLLMDETFAKASGGRLYSWQPATGELREKRWFYF